MKTSLKVLFLLAFLFPMTESSAPAQSFEKGNKIMGAGIKTSFYKVNNKDEKVGESDDDVAASYTFPIGFEYALSNRFGTGIEIGICNYFTGEDTLTGAIADAGSLDVLLSGNFHWVRGGHVDLYSGIGLGISAFRYESNDSKNSRFKSSGVYFRLGLMNARFFISKSFALSLHFGIPYMNFNNGRIEDDLGSDYSYPMVFTGIDLGTGLAFRF
jgi:hypothetical protein